MKKLQIFIPALAIAMAFTACHTGRHTIVSSNDNGRKIKLEIWGSVTLNNTHSAIENISSGGYVDYKKNDDDLRITNDDNGILYYEVNGTKVDHLDGNGQALLTEAVSKIADLPNGH